MKDFLSAPLNGKGPVISVLFIDPVLHFKSAVVDSILADTVNCITVFKFLIPNTVTVERVFRDIVKIDTRTGTYVERISTKS